VIDNNYTLTQFRKIENSKYRFLLRNRLIKKFSQELNLSNRRATYDECVNIIQRNNYSWKDFYTKEPSKYAYLTRNGFVEKIRKQCDI
jgi:galactokinase